LILKCKHKIDQQIYAVKIISKNFSKNEIEIYKRINKSGRYHVVRYFNSWEEDDKVFI